MQLSSTTWETSICDGLPQSCRARLWAGRVRLWRRGRMSHTPMALSILYNIPKCVWVGLEKHTYLTINRI